MESTHYNNKKMKKITEFLKSIFINRENKENMETKQKKKRGPVTYTALQQGEQMKQITGYPHYYITNFGRVLSTRPIGNTLKPSNLREISLSYGNERYFYANIYNENNFRSSLKVSRLVYQHFNDKEDYLKEGYVIDHIDGNKLNNHIDNLRQITQSENILHYHRNQKQNG